MRPQKKIYIFWFSWRIIIYFLKNIALKSTTAWFEFGLRIFLVPLWFVDFCRKLTIFPISYIGIGAIQKLREQNKVGRWSKIPIYFHQGRKCPRQGRYLVDVLWCQPIKLIQVVSTSEFHEYWWNDIDFIFFVPSI